MVHKDKKYSVLQNCLYVVKDATKNYPLVMVYSLIISFLSVLLSMLWAYMPATVLKGIEEHWKLSYIILAVAAIAVGMAIANFAVTYFAAVHSVAKNNCRQQYILYVNKKIMNCRYQTIENADVQVKIEQVENLIFPDNDSIGINAVLCGVKNLILTAVGVVSCIAILQQLSGWIILFVPVISLINTLIGRLCDRYYQKNRDNWSKTDKKIAYINEKLILKEYGKDISAYGCEDWILDRLESHIRERAGWFRKIQNFDDALGVIRILVNLVYDVVVMGYAVWGVLNGSITLSSFVLYMGLISQLSSFINRFLGSFNSLIAGSNDVQLIRDFLEKDEQLPAKTGLKEQVGEGPLSIRLENVSFRYTEEGEDVISNLNLCIQKGEKVALVGENGAGKSTLIKLISGMYRPTEGEIYLNDVPVSEYAPEEIYELLSVAFQDFVVLPFSIACNVAMAEEQDVDRELVRRCLTEVGLDKYAADMDEKLISEAHVDGRDLSGGEVQRMLIARALYKNAPILLLDEPTAALDAVAESELYQKYHSLTAGKTSLFISHRLASTRFCDRILFMKNGGIAEEGTHEELLAAGKEYAELFELQSRYYKDSGECA
ncbi:MAG: ABC transporter ATP-binding protein [Lachnospiraceae bacterium]|nr:ABC transporter ATP-binding protein [Lachnospiraceae bacterium]